MSRVVERINGFGILLRFFTPLMVGVCLAFQGEILKRIDRIDEKLSYHLEVNFPGKVTEVYSRLSVLESKVGIKGGEVE